MNNYYVAGTSQGTTSNWVSGKDFTFNYMGTDLHPLDGCTLSYIRVLGNGEADLHYESNIYVWKTQNNTMTGISRAGLTTNATTCLAGSCTDGIYSQSQYELEQSIVLLHDRPWSIQWESAGAWTGGCRLLSTAQNSKNVFAPSLYIGANSGMLAFSYFKGTAYYSYGITLSKHGIDASVSHTYRLTNRVNADGTNMIYLFVDGAELGPMNNYYINTTDKGTTGTWVSGKDFVFSYFGTYRHPITDASIDYLKVWEGGIPADDEAGFYRWETRSDSLTSVGADDNAATALSGSITNGKLSGCYYILKKPVMLHHNRPWSIEWKSEGDWKDVQNGTLLLSYTENANTSGNMYLYRRGGTSIIALGYFN